MTKKKYLVRVIKVVNNLIKASEHHVVVSTSKVKALNSVLSSKDNSWQEYSVTIVH